VGAAVEGEALEDAREAEAVVAVEVGDEDPVDGAGGQLAEGHLALGSFAGVEEEALVVPAQEIAVVVAAAGRNLGRRPEGQEFAVAHEGGPRG
jgi:hypothetical protein